jgi:DNA-binding MarR family transcriptional regulator
MMAFVTPTLTTASAAELLLAFRDVVKRLEQMPLPKGDPARERWLAGRLAPRHIGALLMVVSDEGMSVSTLSERLGVSLATASQLVTDLEEFGLFERFGDPTDRRRTLVRIAETHRDMAEVVLDTRLRPVQRALDRLRPGEQKALLRGLSLIAEELSASDLDTSATDTKKDVMTS